MSNQIILSVVDLFDKYDAESLFNEDGQIEYLNLKTLESHININRINKKCSFEEKLYLLTVLSSSNNIIFINKKTEKSDIVKAKTLLEKNPNHLVVGGYRPKSRFHDLFIKNTSDSLPFIYKKSFILENLDLIKKPNYQLIKKSYKLRKLLLSTEYTRSGSQNNIKKLRVPLFSIIFKIEPISFIKQFIKVNNKKNIKPAYDIPVFINCRDRLDPLIDMIKKIEYMGFQNIIIIDNNSSNKKLLSYYKSSTYCIIRLRQNIGQRAPWESGAVKVFAKDKPFIVTDPDLFLPKLTRNEIKILFNLLNRYPKIMKIGLALRIDNIPDSYKAKMQVLSWEKQFWKEEIEKNIYIADVDTTFALYRPNTPYLIRPSLRIAGKFTAEHEPWYQDSGNPTEDYRYYLSHARREIASWGIDEKTSSDLYKTS